MQLKRRQISGGFTILELMIASSVFAVILLVVAAGVISFTNNYYKGITSAKTQAVTRSIINAVSQSIQFGNNIKSPGSSGGVQGLCVGNTMYSYLIGKEVVDGSPTGPDQVNHALVADRGGCGAPSVSSPLPSTARELLGPHMRLAVFDVQQTGNSLYQIHVRVIYGDDDLLTPGNISASTDWSRELCSGGVAGSQFCAVSDLTTTVGMRL